jgi:chloramphenicol-sensitive protein RarD
MNAAALPAQPHRETRRGFAFGVAAYGLWGVLPIYFKALGGIAAVDIVAHRIVWSLPFLALLLFVSRGWSQVRQAVQRRRTLLLLLSTASLIGINWLLYVYAVTSGHILAASLGYYLNPLANVLLGRFVLKERLSWLQWIAIAIAAAGIFALAVGALGQLWISLTLCISFATYGLLRKIALVDTIAGLGIETSLLFPLAIGWLAWRLAVGIPVLGATGNETALLVAPEWSRRRRSCCSPRPRAGCPIRHWGCSSSSRRRCNSCARCGCTAKRSPAPTRLPSVRSGPRSGCTCSN